MAAKTTPFSVRLGPEDAEFITNLDIKDAVTPSEKIRALIASAREQEQKQSYQDCLEKIQTSLIPVMVLYREYELNHETRSELLPIATEWLGEAMSYVLSQKTNESLDLVQFEQGIADRIFSLLEQILRLCVTGFAPCYNKGIIREKMSLLSELIDIVRSTEV